VKLSCVRLSVLPIISLLHAAAAGLTDRCMAGAQQQMLAVSRCQLVYEAEHRLVIILLLTACMCHLCCDTVLTLLLYPGVIFMPCDSKQLILYLPRCDNDAVLSLLPVQV